ncbi:hypothetical protein F751_6709 [Auxenochlorella protothecoides]|uniref:Uncharacterized protein n=1 Tax=Auxenochlorella protothecoides TaxID=3075 RepID=A0A087SQN0_AUXPR|nr:hypothetical protein F751_6709 [Auxenochlorella protothecoides]KFM28034.1 hypothetical protein F751_6709 [Auxenochlorella protothecoides]RMZ55907.1 hypothetical protein APUTEX25_004331 [Auxenochlorella protothecoides]|eukprot:RMZ55907.1 hypothetical protein APUTEX25_004331 [Auxenochlorella protothecoides]
MSSPGKCGAGPNAVLMQIAPRAPPRVLSHLASPARLLDALQGFTTLPMDRASLRAVELRCAGNAAARAGQPGRAVRLYSQALDLPASRATAHLLLSNRAGARLAAGDAAGAAEDARAAVACAPSDFTTASVRLAEALRALGQAREAAAVVVAAGVAWPAFGEGEECRALLAQLEAEVGRELARAA